MGIQNWSENVILINLAKEPQMGEELQVAAEMVTDKSDCNLVIDFADVIAAGEKPLWEKVLPYAAVGTLGTILVILLVKRR